MEIEECKNFTMNNRLSMRNGTTSMNFEMEIQNFIRNTISTIRFEGSKDIYIDEDQRIQVLPRGNMTCARNFGKKLKFLISVDPIGSRLYRVSHIHEWNEKEEIFIQIKKSNFQANSSACYEMQHYDKIKLGDATIDIVDVVLKNDHLGPLWGEEMYELGIMGTGEDYFQDQKMVERGKCRICLEEEFCLSQSNPLINICGCRGSVQLVHLICIQEWLSSRSEKTLKKGYTLTKYKNFICELCQKHLPIKIKTREGKSLNLLGELLADLSSIVILEKCSRNVNIRNAWVVRVLDEEAKSLSIGRDKDSDILLSCSSVSRKHAILKFEPRKGFFIEDRPESKAGTWYKLFPGVTVQRNLLIRSKDVAFTLSPENIY